MRRFLNSIMMAAFVASAGVQYNDPDPIRWMAIYLAAFGLCVAWHRGRLPRWIYAGAAVSAVLGAIAVAMAVPEGADVWIAVGDWHMKESGSELIRESGGLGFVALWMAVLSWWSFSAVPAGGG